jgi:class 3 adenylate cyclase/WD40 repeat protein
MRHVLDRPADTGSAGNRGTAGVRTFLIADIRGWTAFTSERGDEAASQLAAKFAELVGEGVEAWGGQVVELRGDEALAVFDSPRDALRASLDLQGAFEAETSIEPDLPLTVGIGLDAGEAVPVGDGYRGAALNVAARLCAEAKAGETLATQDVAHLAGPLPGISYAELAPTQLKGLKHEITPIRVTPAERKTPAEPAGAPIGRQDTDLALPAELEPIVPLAGRQSELRWLAWHWRRTRHGDGRLVVISGVPGIGKTRLASELATLAHAGGGAVTYIPSSRQPADLTDAARGDRARLIVVDDLDAAPFALATGVAQLRDEVANRPVMVVVIHRDQAARELLSIVERLAPERQRRRLAPLGPESVRAIAALYAGGAADRVPVSELIERSGGIPAAVHRWSSAWARQSIGERLEDAARRTSDSRRTLRAAEDELISGVSDMELVRDRSELFLATASDSGISSRVGTCPYKGLAAFEATDADYYFGRERLVAELVARLVGSNFLALIGASGSGKSSALSAGLIPALAGGVLPGSESWRVVTLRPGEHPMLELERALGSDLEAALAGVTSGQRLLLVVDQFEEVFNSTRDEAERARFVEVLTTDREALKVVLAVRADHYGHCAAYPPLAQLVGGSSVLVGALSSAELAAVIEHPANRVGLRVEPELTQALLADVGDEPGTLPLLSTALLELWQAREGGWLTLAAYRAAGGVRGAVARLGESAYAALTTDQRHLARSIFLRLAGVGEGAAIVRRRVPLEEFSARDNGEIDAALQKLVSARVLTAGDGYVEVAHEALLREWPRFQTWLQEDAAGRQLRLHVIGASSDWAARGREAGDLYRGARLAAALEWAGEHDEELNALEREFLQQSRQESEAEVERQRRTNRRLRLLLAGAGVLLVLTVAGGGFAAYQAELARQSEQAAIQAEDQARQSEQSARDSEQNALEAQETAEQAEQFARSRELAASAIAARDEDPALSKLLAIASASIADPPLESVAALHRAWDADRVIYRYAWPADHDVGYLNVDIDPSARYVVAAGGAFEGSDYVEVVDRVSDERRWSFQPSTEGLRVGAAYFTPDGSRVVFGAFFGAEPPPGASSAEAGIYVRDAHTGAVINTIATGDCGASVVAVSNITAIAYTSNAPTCLTFIGSPFRHDLSLESIDLATGQRTTLTNAASGNDADAVSADGSTVVFDDLTEEGSATVIVARPFTGQRVALPDAWTMDISTDGSRLVVDDGTYLKVWDLDVANLSTLSGAPPISVFAPDYNTHAYFAEFALDGLSVFSTGADGHLHQWDIESGDEIFSYGAAELRPAPSTAGLVLVPSAAGHEALLIDTSLRAEITTFDNTAFAATAFPGDRCGRSRAQDPLSSIDGLSSVANVVAVSNDCWDDATPVTDTLTLLDRTSLEAIGLVRAGAVGALSPDGTRLARRSHRIDDRGELFWGPVEVVDVASGQTLFQLEGLCWFDSLQGQGQGMNPLRKARLEHANAGCSDFPATPFAMAAYQRHDIRWSPDGRMIALIDFVDGYVGIWNALDGTLIAGSLDMYDPALRAYDVAFTPDSTHLVISYTTELAVFATSNALATVSTTDWQVEATRELPAGAVNVYLLGPSADGSSMIAVSGKGGFNTAADKTLYWIDPITLVDTRPPVPRIIPSTMVAATLNDDSTLVALGAADGSIRVWDDNGRLVHQVDFPGHPILGLAFISDTHLGVLLDDGQLRVVTLDAQELLDIARNSLTRGFTQEECDRYHFDPCPTLEQMRSPLGL